MTDKWQLYSQTGVDGPEYGVRIRPGYVVVGFQKEDAQAIVAWQNASIQPEGDILERIGATKDQWGDQWNLLEEAAEEIERLRSENDRAERAHESLDYMRRHEIAAKAARIRELGSEVEQLRSENKIIADRAAHHEKQDAAEIELLAARITELEAEAQEYHDKKEEALTLCAGLNRYIERLEAAFLDHLAARLYYERYRLNRSLWADYPEEPCQMRPKEDFRQDAREALEQIRSSNHIVEANQMVLTTEQLEAVQYLIELATDGKYPPYPGGVLAEKIEILRSLLDGKAGGKDETQT